MGRYPIQCLDITGMAKGSGTLDRALVPVVRFAFDLDNNVTGWPNELMQ